MSWLQSRDITQAQAQLGPPPGQVHCRRGSVMEKQIGSVQLCMAKRTSGKMPLVVVVHFPSWHSSLVKDLA